MAISVSAAWEIRPTGSATNGGGYVAGASGTDYSQQVAAQIAVTDAVANGTTTITSATAGFGSTHPGNIIYLAGGSGSLTATRRQVVSVTNATTIVVDATVATGTGITLNLGGALDGLVALSGAMVASNKAFMRSGAYTETVTPTFSVGASSTNTAPPSRIIGYYQTRGDIVQDATGVWLNNANRPVITLATNTGLSGISITGTGWVIDNIAVDCASLGTSTGIKVATNQQSKVRNCLVKNFTSAGISIAANTNEVSGNEITLGTSAATGGIVITGNRVFVLDNNVHDNACMGVNAGIVGCLTLTNNLITNNTGASSDGVQIANESVVRHNTIHGNGRHGINGISTNTLIGLYVDSNILTSNGGYGIQLASAAGIAADVNWDGNAYWNNTSGTRNNMDDTGGTNPINGVAPYTNTFDVILAGDPYVDKTNNDYRLNNTAGAAARGHGVPRSWPGNTLTTSSPDMGVSQHADPTSGGLIIPRAFQGGYNG